MIPQRSLDNNTFEMTHRNPDPGASNHVPDTDPVPRWLMFVPPDNIYDRPPVIGPHAYTDSFLGELPIGRIVVCKQGVRNWTIVGSILVQETENQLYLDDEKFRPSVVIASSQSIITYTKMLAKGQARLTYIVVVATPSEAVLTQAALPGIRVVSSMHHSDPAWDQNCEDNAYNTLVFTPDAFARHCTSVNPMKRFHTVVVTEALDMLKEDNVFQALDRSEARSFHLLCPCQPTEHDLPRFLSVLANPVLSGLGDTVDTLRNYKPGLDPYRIFGNDPAAVYRWVPSVFIRNIVQNSDIDDNERYYRVHNLVLPRITDWDHAGSCSRKAYANDLDADDQNVPDDSDSAFEDELEDIDDKENEQGE